MGGCKILFCSSKFRWAGEINFSKFIDNLGTRNQKKGSSLLVWGSHDLCSRTKNFLHVGHVSSACPGGSTYLSPI